MGVIFNIPHFVIRPFSYVTIKKISHHPETHFSNTVQIFIVKRCLQFQLWNKQIRHVAQNKRIALREISPILKSGPFKIHEAHLASVPASLSRTAPSLEDAFHAVHADCFSYFHYPGFSRWNGRGASLWIWRATPRHPILLKLILVEEKNTNGFIISEQATIEDFSGNVETNVAVTG